MPHCLVPEGRGSPATRRATLVLVRPGGDTLGFSCAEHRDAWAARIRGEYQVLKRDQWVAQGAGYRGVMMGG